ncbi:MAG TPA: hypothetical protein VNO70_10285, partial [Blastocatellia bacterium]|nr:hypothetical protein [Blastocatellia bacterium]
VLADFLNVPVGWVYKRTRQNGPELIPHIKLGKYIRFDPESREFQSWLAGKAIAALTTPVPLHKVRPEQTRRA